MLIDISVDSVLPERKFHRYFEIGGRVMSVSGIILAGGRSLRMGRDKSLLLFDNESLIERTARKLSNLVDEIIIASNHTAKYNLPGVIEVPDNYPGIGPLGGIHAGLIAAKWHYSFVIACDMPFFSPKLAQYMLERTEGYDAVVAKIQEFWEPLCAVYSKNCIHPIEKCLRSSPGPISTFYHEVKIRKIDENELRTIGNLEDFFRNINTPNDLNCITNADKLLSV